MTATKDQRVTSHGSHDHGVVFHGPQRAAKGNEDTAQPVWGQGFDPVSDGSASHGPQRKRGFPTSFVSNNLRRAFNGAAELPLGAELYVSAGRTGDLVAGQPVTLTTAS